MSRTTFRRRTLALVLPVAAFVAACGGSDDDLDDRLDLADPKVRLVHAVPLAPSVSLFRNDVAQSGDVTNKPYLTASNYFDDSTDTARWDVRTATSPAATVGSVTFDARRGTKYTLVAVPDAGSLTRVVNIADPYNKSVASDNARLRVFNGSFNATPYDVYVTAPTADLAATTPTFANIGYQQAAPASGSDSVEVESNTYRIRFTTAGTKTVIFNREVSVPRNGDWLLVTVPNSVNANDVRVLLVQADSSSPATELLTQ